MVAMGMRYHGPLYRPPGIDVKLPLRAVQAFIGKFYQGHGKERYNICAFAAMGRLRRKDFTTEDTKVFSQRYTKRLSRKRLLRDTEGLLRKPD
jgi:hypothetical protein